MKLSELDSLKLDNARLELALIKVEQQLNDAQAQLLVFKEANQIEKNKKIFTSLDLKDGKVTLKRNPDGIYETQEDDSKQ